MKLGISTGPVSNATVTPWEASWDELITTLQSPEVGTKGGSYFTICTFKDDYRNSDNAQYPLQGVVLDLDKRIDRETGEAIDGAPPLELAHKALVERGIKHVLYSSHSHLSVDDGYHRGRVVVPCRINTQEEHKAVVNWLFELLRESGVMAVTSDESLTVPQPWFLPRIREAGAPFYFAQHTKSKTPLAIGEAVAWHEELEREIASTIPESGPARDLDPNSPIDKFCMDHGIDYVVELLREHGFPLFYSSMINNLPSYHLMTPSSSNQRPGINVYSGRDNGKVLVCSHHTGNHCPLWKRQQEIKQEVLDAFEVFVLLVHKGDREAALKAIKGGETAIDTPSDLSQFVMNGSSEKMRQQMLDDRFILGLLAILGQWTTFYAAPNLGKTLLALYLLIQAIKSGEINGADVFYINADDTYKGQVEKLELAEKHGFQMMAPNQNGFKAKMLSGIMQKMIEADTAKGKVVILDTLKKFTDLMDKKAGSEFGEIARGFVAAGGSMIALAHVNKHKDAEGKSVHAGTTDIKDDSDCAYIVEVVSKNGDTKTVQFENIKARGDVAETAAYQYTRKEGQTYFELLDTVKAVSDEEVGKGLAIEKRQQFLDDNRGVINAVVGCIKGGITLKSELIKEVMDRTAETKRVVSKVLLQCAGEGGGKFWNVEHGERNAHHYRLHDGVETFGPIF